MQAPDNIEAQIANCDAIIINAQKLKRALEEQLKSTHDPGTQKLITAALLRLNNKKTGGGNLRS